MLIPQGLRLVHSGAVAQANMKLATVNAGAMIDIGVDMSTYAGNDAGNTPHMLILYDSSGKRMQGFIGASGAGLAYGAEKVTDGDCETALPTMNGIVFSNYHAFYILDGGQFHAGVKSVKITGNVSSTEGSVRFLDGSNCGLISGTIYKVEAWAYLPSAQTMTQIAHSVIESGGSIWMLQETEVTDTWIKLQGYFTDNDVQRLFWIRGLGTETLNQIFYVDDLSCKPLTDISTNGVHLHSTRGGVNRNVASIDSAFNLTDNSGYTFKLYKCP